MQKNLHKEIFDDLPLEPGLLLRNGAPDHGTSQPIGHKGKVCHHRGHRQK